MPNAILSVILASILVLSLVSITNVYDANAKILPSSRADLAISVGITAKEIVHQDGGITYQPTFATEGNFLNFYKDVGKLHRIFDKVIVPAIGGFVEKHKTQLANKTIDDISIDYDISSNNIFISMSGTSVFDKIYVDPILGMDRPRIITSISMRIPVSANPGWPGNYHTLSFNILPNASPRVAYLATQMLEILEKHKEKLITDVTYDDQGVAIGKGLPSISSIMFDDMSRTTVVGRMITEYDVGVQLVIPYPPSTGTLYQPVAFDVSKPVLFAKSVDESVIISSTIALFGEIPETSLTYPDGQKVSLLPSKTESDKESDYKAVEFRCRLNPSDPDGIYEIQFKAQADKVYPQNSGSFVTKAHPSATRDCGDFTHVEEKIPSEFPVDIGLFDRNDNQVEPEGSVLVADKIHPNVSLVLPQKKYTLKMNIESSPSTKKFSTYYIVKISEYESGYTSQIKSEEVTIHPGMRSQEFEIPLRFEEGVYKIEVFLWNDLDNPNVLIAKPFVSNQIVKAITIETTDKARYVGERNSTLIGSTYKHLNTVFREIISAESIINPHGSVGGGGMGYLFFQDGFTLIVSSEQPVYGDIVYYGGNPREWKIVKQDLSREFRIDVQIPAKQVLFNYKWGFYVLNPNDEPVTANVTTITTNHYYQLEEGKSQSSISLMATPESVSLNDLVTLEGKIDPPHSAKVSVVMTTISLREEVVELTTNSNAGGEYKIMFRADTAGRWGAQAVWEGDEDHVGAVSEGVTFNVEIV